MICSLATGKSARAQAPSGRQWWHSFWLWLSVALTIIVLVLSARSAAAQTERGTEIIERALALQANRRGGASLYWEYCASCHRRRARGNATTVTPSLAGQLPLYLIKQLADFAEGDRVAPEMHRVVALKRLSTPQALRDVAAYLSELAPNPEPELGDGQQLAIGKKFYEGLCAFCHGMQGEGNDQHATPSLQRQHYSYLLMEMRRLAVGHRYSVDISVIEALEALPFDYLTAVADYAARLPTTSAEPERPAASE